MLLFCRNCGKELALTPEKTCRVCGSRPTKSWNFCRYCANTTNVQDEECPTCGAAVRPISSGVRSRNQENPWLVELGSKLNMVIVVALISLYVVATIPKSITKPVKIATAQVILDVTGYKELPLSSISVVPPSIPQVNDQWHAHHIEEVLTPEGVPVDTAHQLTVFAIYGNTTLEDITDKVVYTSSDERIASINATGSVKALGSGFAVISVSYTAAPGTANLSSPAAGKVPVTLNVYVPINVY